MEPIRLRASAAKQATAEVEDVPDSYYNTRLPTSARRYYTTTGEQVIQQGNKRFVVHEPPVTKQHSRIRLHPLVFVGLFLFIMIFGWLSFNAVTTWWQIHQDDVTYGRPRTYQLDAVVGHGDSQQNPSHFMAMNLNRHVFVIECPGGDCTKAKIFNGPTLLGNGQDLTPVTLTFKDVDEDGKLDMEVHILDQTIIYINTGTDFRPLKPGEQVTP